MSLKTRVAQLATELLTPEELQEVAQKTAIRLMAQMDREEKLAFIQAFIEDNISQALIGLGREERAELMNSLLPMVAQEFPLADLDLLGAFPLVEKGSEEEIRKVKGA